MDTCTCTCTCTCHVHGHAHVHVHVHAQWTWTCDISIYPSHVHTCTLPRICGENILYLPYLPYLGSAGRTYHTYHTYHTSDLRGEHTILLILTIPRICGENRSTSLLYEFFLRRSRELARYSLALPPAACQHRAILRDVGSGSSQPAGSIPSESRQASRYPPESHSLQVYSRLSASESDSLQAGSPTRASPDAEATLDRQVSQEV